MQYEFLYYPALIYGLFSSILLRKYWNRFSNNALIFITSPVIIVYMIGMARSKGVDINVYKIFFME